MSYADVSRRVDSSRRLSTCLLTVCLTLATLTARLPEAAADTITAVPSSSNVLVNELFTVDFVLDDFTDLFLFQMGISYDPSLLLLVGDPTEGSHLASGGSFVSGDTSTPGVIRFIANALSGPTGVDGGGTLFSAQFRATAAGMANIFAVFDLDPLVGDGLYNSAFDLTTPLVLGADVSISAPPDPPPTSVPEPATILSLGFGVGVLAVARRREQRRRLPRR